MIISAVNGLDIILPLSYGLTTFQILGPKIVVGILVQTMTPKGHFEIN